MCKRSHVLSASDVSGCRPRSFGRQVCVGLAWRILILLVYMIINITCATLRACLPWALAAVVCIIVGLVGFHVYFVRRWLLRLIRQNGLIARYDVLSRMVRRCNSLGDDLILAHHDAILQLDPVLDRRLPHHVQRLGGDAANRHCVIQVVSWTIAALLILLVVLVSANGLARERHQI